MKKTLHTVIILLLALLALSCNRSLLEPDAAGEENHLPEGVPVTLILPFSGNDLYQVEVGTKAESSRIDESRIHDLYVMIFENGRLEDSNGDGDPDSHPKVYGRYFSYDHLKGTLAELNTDDHESWFVDNMRLGASVSQTVGAVKISTISCTDAKLVVIANVKNAISNLDQMDALDRLKAVQYYEELQSIQVCLEQDVVNRKDLFLMTGELDVNTTQMVWGTLPSSYNSNYTVRLTPVDAKVKFRIKVNPQYISDVTPNFWQVNNVPDRCYLYSCYNECKAPAEITYFESQEYYFEGTEEDENGKWHTFCFYMLENRETGNGLATKYYQRELRNKIDTGEGGYLGGTGSESDGLSDHFVTNGDWRFAPTFGTYVRFDMMLTLNAAGIAAIGSEDPQGMTIGHALTSDAAFTVHLGNFGNSSNPEGSSLFNDYNTLRGHFYTYNITINNTRSIYTEVMTDEEVQSGQEGFLLLTDSEIINADCHYEYHQMTFEYRPEITQDKFSWYVKTPFGQGGPRIIKMGDKYTYDTSGLDFQWIKFGLNKRVAADYDPADDAQPDPVPYYSDIRHEQIYPYTNKRHKYPGDGNYDPNWDPTQTELAENQLMDVSQLVQYLFVQTRRQKENGESDFVADNAAAQTVPVIRVTAFVDEYYYERNPLDPSGPYDPELWRKFVNANPRELHILSDARSSRDRNSDVILSSHSVIQHSIQTIYNIYDASLESLWGTEHIDEMREKTDGWRYWPVGLPGDKAGNFNTMVGKENGRLNSAYIWGLYTKDTEAGNDNENVQWSNFLNYDVRNNIPELLVSHQGMAWSCLTRNRDNNGNGIIERDEVRWYLAASNQLAGLWVGNESLSMDARLYRPAQGQWRAHVISSSGRRVSWTEEGGGATDYNTEWGNGAETWPTQDEASKGESVRCLRNIGSYDNEDITRAPYRVQPNRYFTITPEPSAQDGPDTRYVFHFDRLNPKSLRELTQKDLPYHDQFSVTNSVYLKMETQSREDELLIEPGSYVVDGKTYRVESNHTYKIANKDINPVVTKLDFNPFCPPGYRFPNHKEELLMSLYLPDNYHKTNSAGETYNGVYSPSRTYYDRGIYGLNTTGFEYDYRGFEATRKAEQGKTGWSWSDKLHCAKNNDNMTVSRCVRDEDMTGTIDGGLLVGSTLYPGDAVPLSFSFYSSGASFISASLKLCYTDQNGIYHERDIPVSKTPTGQQFLADQTVYIPSLSELNLTEELLDAEEGRRSKTKFKVTLRNAYASQTFEQPFYLGNPLQGELFANEDEDDDALYPDDSNKIRFAINSLANSCPITRVSLELYYTDSDKKIAYSLITPTSGAYNNTQRITIPALADLSSLIGFDNEDIGENVTLKVNVADEGGSTASITKQVPLSSHIKSVTVDFPSEFTGDGVPVMASAAVARSATVTSAVLQRKSDEGDWADWDSSLGNIAATPKKVYTSETATSYSYRIVATCSDGTSKISRVRSMELLKFNFTPQSEKWTDEPRQLNFAEGDYLEAQITMDKSVKKSGLLSIGQNIGDWSGGSHFHMYTGDTTAEFKIRSAAYYNSTRVDDRAQAETVHSDPDINILFNKEGLFLDGKDGNESQGGYFQWSKITPNYKNLVQQLTGNDSIQVGQSEGTNRSKSTYHYIRVIRER